MGSESRSREAHGGPRLASLAVRRSAALVVLTFLAISCGIGASSHQTSSGATSSPQPSTASAARLADTITFAVIGDYGMGNGDEASVASLVKSWSPNFVVATGDDYYSPAGGSESARYDDSTGKDYCEFLAGITTTGTNCPQPGPSAVNRFFPSLGNHDYTDAGTIGSLPATYTSYFSLPGSGVTNPDPTGNERYYDYVQGPVQFFVLNSNSDPGEEPDGTSAASTQAAWLKNALAASTAPWKIVYFHHPPYTSGTVHGPSAWMQWPFAQWGANVVLSGHEHLYERILRDGVVYFVNGIGGASRYPCGKPIAGSQFCYTGSLGAQRVTASASSLTLDFITVDGVVRDTQTLTRSTTVPASTITPDTTSAAAPNPVASPSR